MRIFYSGLVTAICFSSVISQLSEALKKAFCKITKRKEQKHVFFCGGALAECIDIHRMGQV